MLDGADDVIIGGGATSFVVFGGAGIGSSGVIELSALDSSNGFNNLLISDVWPASWRCAGMSYVVFGSAGAGSSGVIELSALGETNGFVLNGVAAYDDSGHSVSAAGDVNADGVDDLLIGAMGADPTGNGSGASYVVFGD